MGLRCLYIRAASLVNLAPGLIGRLSPLDALEGGEVDLDFSLDREVGGELDLDFSCPLDAFFELEVRPVLDAICKDRAQRTKPKPSGRSLERE
ncbi:hypothetical protein BDZ91DRAFT_337722 [Kalaharituber pfeilii]|nr:hypothetical protein BDZ91DRAFT_337722 [Kalaharituber pfeilii]